MNYSSIVGDQCPECGATSASTVESLSVWAKTRKRYRKCKECGASFVTLSITSERLEALTKSKATARVDEFSHAPEIITAMLEVGPTLNGFIGSRARQIDQAAVEECSNCKAVCFQGQVIETRSSGMGLIRRRKQCHHCSARTTLYEVRRDSLQDLLTLDVDWDEVEGELKSLIAAVAAAKQGSSF